jgi:hypothetical protein
VTGVVVGREGLRVDLGYKEVPLDVVSDEDLYARWMRGSVSAESASIGDTFGVIQYHRKIGHRSDDVPDYQG